MGSAGGGGWVLTPPLLTPGGSHQNMYGWQASGTYPTGMFPCTNLFTKLASFA